MWPQGRGGSRISLGQGQGHLASHSLCGKDLFFFSNSFIFLIYFNWRLITLQYCGGFCHTQGAGADSLRGQELRDLTLVVPDLNMAKEK